MKICFCIGRLTFSGAENVIRYLAKGLIERNHEVSVILTEQMPKPQDMINGLTVSDAIIREGGPVNAIRRIKAIRRSLIEISPDIFVIFNFAMAFTAVPASIGLGWLKVVVCERNPPQCVPKTKARKIARDILFHFSDACVSQTDEIAAYFARITRRNYVIPNPIRTPGVMCPDVSERKKVFVTVARLDDYQKNQSMMIRAFARAAAAYPEYELHFLGEGADREKYERLIGELGITRSVKFLGNVSEPLAYVKECRAFLLSSNYEGMPNALIEAMSIGLPCITTDCMGGAASALITNGVNGVLVPLADEHAFADSMVKLIQSDELCRKLGKNAFDINQTLDGNRIIDEWEKILAQLLEEEHK